MADDEKRRIYDRYGEDGLKQKEQQSQGGFGGMFTQRKEQTTPNIEFELGATLEELYVGSTIMVMIFLLDSSK